MIIGFLGFTVSCIDMRSIKGDFSALIIADTHVNNDLENDIKIADFVELVNDDAWPGVELVINLGDVVSSVYDKYDKENPSKNVHRLAKADSLFKELEVPYYFVMGNHDYKIEQKRDSDTYFPVDEILRMEAHWKDVTGFDPYFSVVNKGWKFIFMNSMRGRYLNRHFDPDQIKWFEEELKEGYPSILCFHHPLLTDNIRIPVEPHDQFIPDSEPKFYSILEEYKDHVKGIFVGHGHQWLQDRLFGIIPAYMAASFGDSEGFEYYLVGFNSKGKAINVRKNVAPENEEGINN